MLGRRLGRMQWLALGVLTGGLVVIQLKDDSSAARPGHMPRNTLSGAGAMLCSTILSAYSGVYLEKLFKTVRAAATAAWPCAGTQS